MNEITQKIEAMTIKQLLIIAIVLALVIIMWRNRDLLQAKALNK